MTLRQRIEKLEKQVKTFLSGKPDPEDIEDREMRDAIWGLPKLPVGTPEQEQSLQDFARRIISDLLAREDPNQPHYPPIFLTALGDRYGIKLSEYAINEKHAEILDRYS